MENIIDLIATDASPSEIRDSIKTALFSKAAEKIELARPYVANTMFGEQEVEVEDEIDQESQENQE